MKNVLFCLLLFIGLAGFAQQAEIRGTVLEGEDEKQPLAFAEVRIKGTSLSTTTGMDGSFAFDLLPGTYSFVVDFIGYETAEIRDLVLTEKDIDIPPVILKARRIASPIVASVEE